MSSRRRFPMRHPAVVVDVGCHCGRGKLSSLFSSLKLKTTNTTTNKNNPIFSPTSYSSSYSSIDTSGTTSSSAAFSAAAETPKICTTTRRRRGCRKRSSSGWVAGESVAVAKETASPYEEFKESMVQMIIEKEIYGWDDLRDLLHRLLELNSPSHHPLILRAFADVCRTVFSPAGTGE